MTLIFLEKGKDKGDDSDVGFWGDDYALEDKSFGILNAISEMAKLLESENTISKKEKPIMKVKLVYKGGDGSGHHGHAGRPGKVGGSLPSKDQSGDTQNTRAESGSGGKSREELFTYKDPSRAHINATPGTEEWDAEITSKLKADGWEGGKIQYSPAYSQFTKHFSVGNLPSGKEDHTYAMVTTYKAGNVRLYIYDSHRYPKEGAYITPPHVSKKFDNLDTMFTYLNKYWKRYERLEGEVPWLH